jgi:hypothetical protein
MGERWYNREVVRPNPPGKYEAVFIIPPIVLMCCSLLVVIPLGHGLAAMLRVPEGVPLINQPNGLMWFCLFIASMSLLLLCGGLLGMALNVAILRFGWGWSWILIGDARVCPDRMLARLANLDQSLLTKKGLTAGTIRSTIMIWTMRVNSRGDTQTKS